jgi:hypothetical protein
MTHDEIKARAERIGSKGADMRTAIVDVEVTLDRTMDEAELRAFRDGWKASWPARDARQAARDQAAADAARAARG